MADVKDPDLPTTTTSSNDNELAENNVDVAPPNTTSNKDKNATAATDVKNLLAELEAEGAAEKHKTAEVNESPTTNEVDKVEDSQPKEDAIAGTKEENVANGENTMTKEQAVKADKETDKDAEKSEGKTAVKESDKAEEKAESKADEKSSEDQPKKPEPSARERKPAQSSRSYRGGRDFRKQDFSKNVKSDYSKFEQSNDPVAIRKQVEFYFSDSNLPMDKFLLGKVGGSKNNPVELDILHNFKRMRHFQPRSAIVEALKTSSVVELTDDNTAIRRKVPLPENVSDTIDRDTVKVFQDAAMSRSVYAKGFGEETPSTQFDIEAFFAPYGPTNAVRLRRSHDKIFKGSVFVEFDREEGQKKFLELDPKPTYKGNELLIKSKLQYCEEKAEDIRAGRIKGNSDDHRGTKRKAEDDKRDWRERRNEDRKSGFQDRDGKRHKGFGNRGGRGGHGGRGGRGGHNDRRHKRYEAPVNDHDPKIPVVRSTKTPPPQEGKETDKEMATHKVDSGKAVEKKDTTPEKTSEKRDAGKPIEKNEGVSDKIAENKEPEKKENGMSPSEPAVVPGNSSSSPSRKRAREDDDLASEEKPAKKIETGDESKGKAEAAAA